MCGITPVCSAELAKQSKAAQKPNQKQHAPRLRYSRIKGKPVVKLSAVAPAPLAVPAKQSPVENAIIPASAVTLADAPQQNDLKVREDAPPAPAAQETSLRFDIRSYTLDGGSLLDKAEIDRTVAPYIGKSKDFTDVQRALEAVEELYVRKGYSAVHVSLPEQELEQGNIRFRVIESRLAAITVRNSKFIKFFSDDNVLRALPSVRAGNFPRAKHIARELQFANENPARQLNVVLKAAEKDEGVDATVIVTESKPSAWNVTLDNTGSPETGRSRLGLSYRHANLFDRDHAGSLQAQVSPEYMDRVRVLSGSYKIPFYQWGDSADFSLGYSNVNSLVGGFANFQGGGVIFGSHYNRTLDKWGSFEPHLIYGLDIRDFKTVQQTTPPVTVMYNEVMVMPVSLGYSAQGKMEQAEVGFNVMLAANLPWLSQGRKEAFVNYDLVDPGKTYTVDYRMLRFGGNYVQTVSRDWQLHAAFNGQWSGDVLVQGEQLRLGGADGVRGFSEGSEGGEKGVRANLEAYTPAYLRWNASTRALLFLDAGTVSATGGTNAFISSAGVGMRSSFANHMALRMDFARILKAGSDPMQQAGTWRAHLALSANF